MPASLFEKFEHETVAALFAKGARPTSQDAFAAIVKAVNGDLSQGRVTRLTILQLRFAIQLNPYAPQLASIAGLHDQIVKKLAEQVMPELMQILDVCAEKKLPLPLIVSCEKYLPKALELQKILREKVWGLTPVILRGDLSLNEEKFDAPVLSLPVADSYETLPLKMFEAYTFFRALAPQTGIIKIDDDLTPIPGAMSAPEQALAILGAADYMGVAVENLAHDRLWHHGKCSQPVPPVYAKPVKAPWARGALYYLSPYALEKLALWHMRFPACLEGERYEDKAAGDALFDNGVKLTPFALENLLLLDSRHEHR